MISCAAKTVHLCRDEGTNERGVETNQGRGAPTCSLVCLSLSSFSSFTCAGASAAMSPAGMSPEALVTIRTHSHVFDVAGRLCLRVYERTGMCTRMKAHSTRQCTPMRLIATQSASCQAWPCLYTDHNKDPSACHARASLNAGVGLVTCKLPRVSSNNNSNSQTKHVRHD
jgi:hypothetical protein